MRLDFTNRKIDVQMCNIIATGLTWDISFVYHILWLRASYRCRDDVGASFSRRSLWHRYGLVRQMVATFYYGITFSLIKAPTDFLCIEPAVWFVSLIIYELYAMKYTYRPPFTQYIDIHPPKLQCVRRYIHPSVCTYVCIYVCAWIRAYIRTHIWVQLWGYYDWLV